MHTKLSTRPVGSVITVEIELKKESIYTSAVRSLLHNRLSVGGVDTAAESYGYQRKTNLQRQGQGEGGGGWGEGGMSE